MAHQSRLLEPMAHQWLTRQSFFMAEAKPVQPAPDRGAMHRQAMHRGQFRADLVQRQIGFAGQPIPHPIGVGRQLARCRVALLLGQKAPTFAFEDHHVIHKSWRNPKMTRRLSMAISFFNKGDDPTTKLNRMWLPHLDPLHLVRIGDHSSTNLGILNHN